MKQINYLFIIVLGLIFFLPTHAMAKKKSFIRDTEIEIYLKELSKPIFKIANLNSDSIRLYIVNDKSLNAFVAGGQNLFINTGLIMESDNPLLLLGVIAHETGHISGGHLIRKTDDAEKFAFKTALGYILGIGSVIAGAPPEAATAIVAGGQQLGQQDFLKYSRQHEEEADQSALENLRKLNISPSGLLELLEKLQNDQVLKFGTNINKYRLTHPLSKERISHIKNFIDRNFTGKTSNSNDNNHVKSMEFRHKLIIAKLKGFLENPEKLLKNLKNDGDIFDQYTKAVALYRLPDTNNALNEIDGLIKSMPKFPYFYELKGQVLFEVGRIKESIIPYEKALSLKKNEPLLMLELAVSLIATEEKENLERAINLLNFVVSKERENVFAWFELGVAYGKNGNLGMSYIALAEKEVLLGKNNEAKEFLSKAKKYIEKGTPAYLRIQDISNVIDKI